MKNKENLKNEIANQISNIELHPMLVESQVGNTNYTKISLSNIASLGTALEPLSTVFNSVVNGSGGSGLYKVTIPKGMHLAEFKNGSGNIGAFLNTSNQVAGQASLSPIAFNPTMLFVAVALANINKKLDSIQEVQEEMFDFLKQKEKSELTGDLKFLTDILNNYKFNWNNEKYKNGNHIKVLDIKQTSERKIDFYRELIIKATNKKSFIHTDQDIKKQLDKIQDDFGDYQLALYLYSFSTFLEVMLLENFDSTYLNGLTNKIENYSLGYRELYTKCYSQLENNSKTTVQSFLLKGIASANKITGEAASKVSIIKKYQVDETLMEVSNKINEFDEKRILNSMKNMMERQSSFVRPFIENINTMNRLYNQPFELMFDKDSIYLIS